ncbi:MAG TPA: IS110 family transposase [Thermomonas sp.]|nr:IS110 family transposase [Thermomonas sp.]
MTVLALDVGSRKHALAASVEGLCPEGEVANEQAALAALFARLATEDPGAWVVMEATGVYHWDAAMLAHAAGLRVAVLNPKVTANFAKALAVRSKTDPIDARTLLAFGQRMPLTPWQPPRSTLIELRAISRYLLVLNEQLTATRNRLHAGQSMGDTPTFVLREYRTEVQRLETRITKASAEAMVRIRADAELKTQFEALDSIVGVAQASAIALLGELAFLPTAMRAKACVAHAGLDVRHHLSGTSVAKPGRLTKHGNHHLRRALYMPALTAIGHDPHAKAFYGRLVARGKKKMQALCAVMRKLLTAAWALMRSGERYDGSRLFARMEG